MSVEELKEEIKKIIDLVPESELEDVLQYFKKFITAPDGTLRTSKKLKQILTEDRKLLERLAQ